MSYESTYHQRKNSVQTLNAKNPTVSAVGRICRLDAETQRPQRNTERPTKVFAKRESSNGFLNTQFLPKIKVAENESNRSKDEAKRIEIDFYTSLAQLASYYDVQPIQSQHFEYPNNLAVAYWDMKNKLVDNIQDKNDLHIVKTENKQTFLSVSETYETDACLYYVPIYPLFDMLYNNEMHHAKNVLLSVFSYLYRVVGIPFYQEEDAYLYWLYEMLKDWIINGELYDEDDADKEIILTELRKCNCIGEIVLKKIQNEKNMFHWKKRLNNFNPKNEWDKELYNVAGSFHELWSAYPKESIFRYSRYAYQFDNYSDEFLPMDKYLSFYCHFEGLLTEQMNEIINNDLSIYSEMEEPTIHKVFRGQDITEQNFDFEHRFFHLTEQLISLLQNYEP